MARPEDRLTIAQLCNELGISRSTFYEWRAKGRAPRCIKLPNGELRYTRGCAILTGGAVAAGRDCAALSRPKL